jgi:hypothetical protein
MDEINGRTDIWKDRWLDGWTDGEAEGGEMEIQADKQTDR